jgi:hypothetical protein
MARAKLSKATLTGAAFQFAAKHILVKRNHVLKIVHADDKVIDVGDIDRVSFFHDGVSICSR